MRKWLLGPEGPSGPHSESGWLALDDIAAVEITSEDPAYPIEAALVPGRGSEWRAATAGKQMIRIRFDRPEHLSRIARHTVAISQDSCCKCTRDRAIRPFLLAP